MFGDFSKLLNVTAILLIVLQIKFAFSRDRIKIINCSNDIDSLKLVINCSNYQDFNYKISLSLEDDNNNFLQNLILDESNSKNINNNLIESHIPTQSNAERLIYSIEIILENDGKSLIFDSRSFMLSNSNEEAEHDNTVYIDLLNNENNKDTFLSITRSITKSNIVSSVGQSETKYMTKPTTAFNKHERQPIHTKDLETFSSLSLHPESIESLLKLDSNYDSAVRLPLTARKLNLG